jgi:hypothetical protein
MHQWKSYCLTNRCTGMYCPYACPPGQLMAQWDPSAKTYSYPQSMVRYSSRDGLLNIEGANNRGRMEAFTVTRMARSKSHSLRSPTVMMVLELLAARTRLAVRSRFARPSCQVTRQCLSQPSLRACPISQCLIHLTGPELQHSEKNSIFIQS